jgi:hypothetical protein
MRTTIVMMTMKMRTISPHSQNQHHLPSSTLVSPNRLFPLLVLLRKRTYSEVMMMKRMTLSLFRRTFQQSVVLVRHNQTFPLQCLASSSGQGLKLLAGRRLLTSSKTMMRTKTIEL